MEGFFPLQTLEGGLRDGKYCLDLSSARCPNWPEMETFLSCQQDERENMWDSNLAGLGLDTVTVIALSKFNVPRLVASVDEFDFVELPVEVEYLEDDPWYLTVSSENPMKPHYFEAELPLEVSSRAVEFGWCKNRKVIGFCFVESVHVYNDLRFI